MDNISSVKNEFKRLTEEGKLRLPENFYVGEYVRKPDCQGCFPVGEEWYLFRIDERNLPQITGPFSRQGIIYACALMLHQTAGLEEYRFSEKERSNYIHNHYRAPEEIPGAAGNS